MAQNSGWYYEADGKRQGPVPPARLKQLADQGVIAPTSLVWKEGLAEWTPAQAVRGLFPQPAADMPPAPRPDPQPATNAGQPDESLLEALCGLRHPLDLVIDPLRYAIPQDITAKISRVAGLAGVLSIYAAIGIVLLGGLVLASKLRMMWPLAIVIGVAGVLFVLQFVSQRLLQSLDATVSANKTVLSSFAVPDCAFVLILTATLGSTGSILWLAYPEINTAVLAGVLGVCVVGVFSAVVALQPQTIGVIITPFCRAAEEAVGVATFLMKLAIRCVPIFFATAVVVGTWRAAALLLYVLRHRSFDEEFLLAVSQAAGVL